MLDYKPREELIALIQRQESELAKSDDENETLKAEREAMALQLAARQPLADSFVAKPVAGELPPLPEPDVIAYTAIGDNDAYSDMRMREYGRLCRASQPVQQPAAEKDQEVLALHRKLAAETLRADQGWQRYEEANQDRNSLRAERAVPAAGVQGDADKMACVNCHSSKTPGKAKCAECGHDRFAQRPITYPASQPDSGRDAALTALDALHTHMQNSDYYADDSTMPLFNQVVSALAAHPAPSSDAGLSEQAVFDILRDKYLLTEKGKSMLLNGDQLSLHLGAITAIVNCALAAHPANGAQAGLSDKQIDRIAGCNGLYRAMTPDDAACKSMVRRFTVDILAATKKGGAA